MRAFLAELKRRNVIRVAGLYLVGAWLLTQVAGTVLPMFGVPEWLPRSIVILLALGFIPALIFAWVFELTPEGLKRDAEVKPEESIAPQTARRMDRMIIVVLLLALAYFAFDKFVLAPRRDTTLVASTTQAVTAAKAATGVVDAHSIAVLPFVNMSADPAQEFFSDGIAEELLNRLAQASDLHVAARTSAFQFKGRNLDIADIARQLRVANVLQGSVQRMGDEVRISAQLVHAADGYVVWSQRWDRKLDNVFAIQDEIARDVTSQLQVRFGGTAAPRARSTDPRAYAMFLQARELGRQMRHEALLRSDSLYRQVLATDPAYAPAWRELARNFTNDTRIGALPNEEGHRLARTAAGKALAIDSSYAPAHAALGDLASDDGDVAGAARELERALALDPTDLDVLAPSATLLLDLGRLKEAIALGEYVVARDPVNANRLYNLGLSFIYAGRHDDAIARFRTALDLNPGRGTVHYALGKALLLKGDAPAALAEMQLEPTELWRLVALPLGYHALGRRTASDSALAALIGKYPKDAPYNIAYIYAYRGEADRAFAWLDRAVEYGDPGLSEIAVEPFFDRLRADPRWLPFLRRIGRTPEQLARIPFHVRPPSGDAAPVSAGRSATWQPIALTTAPK